MAEANGQEDERADDEIDPNLAAMMGFSGFGTTAQKHVAGNTEYGNAEVKKERKYRQYMNRPGGFNRPLEKMA